jgi:hypothetical protein
VRRRASYISSEARVRDVDAVPGEISYDAVNDTERAAAGKGYSRLPRATTVQLHSADSDLARASDGDGACGRRRRYRGPATSDDADRIGDCDLPIRARIKHINLTALRRQCGDSLCEEAARRGVRTRDVCGAGAGDEQIMKTDTILITTNSHVLPTNQGAERGTVLIECSSGRYS